MTLDPDVVRGRCAEIEESVTRLEALRALPLDRFLADRDAQDIACYRLLIAIEAALAEALANGTIAAAGLDVFEKEPQVNPDLLQLDNAILTPHIASASVDTRREMSMMAARNVLAVLDGRRPANLVNPELWERTNALKGS